MGAGKTVEAWDTWTAEMKAKHGNGNGHGPSLSIEVARLLPTPVTSPEQEQSLDRYGPNLGMVIKDLVSTNPRFRGGLTLLADPPPTLLPQAASCRADSSSG